MILLIIPGCVIIWDIRMSNKLIEFIENGSPVTCLQFHPYEFLLAAGRNDGTVDLYDLESKQMISRTERNDSGGNSVKCITFSDQGECLFVGTAQGVSVIGWEPDREFDRIESNWSLLGDMKIVNKKLVRKFIQIFLESMIACEFVLDKKKLC
jgi:katanin p80 WD40 repeat-containing subunit B1